MPSIRKTGQYIASKKDQIKINELNNKIESLAQ